MRGNSFFLCPIWRPKGRFFCAASFTAADGADRKAACRGSRGANRVGARTWERALARRAFTGLQLPECGSARSLGAGLLVTTEDNRSDQRG